MVSGAPIRRPGAIQRLVQRVVLGALVVAIVVLQFGRAPGAEGPPADFEVAESATDAKVAKWRVFTAAEIAEYDGRDPKKPIYLSVLGEVYDVTERTEYYGPGQSYNRLVGRDGSAAFGAQNVKVEGHLDLDSDQLISAVHWSNFYRGHEVYRQVGVLAGDFYDELGNPTDTLHQLNERRKEIEAHERTREELLTRYAECKVTSMMTQSYYTVRCEEEAGEPRYVRELVISPMMVSQKEQRKCVCVPKARLDDEHLQRYPNCERYPTSCRRSRR